MVPLNTTTVSQKSFRLEVPNISTLNEVWSDYEVVQGIPWNIQFKRNIIEENQYLGIHLFCARSVQNAKHTASATVKLLSNGDDADAIKMNIQPYVFDSVSGVGWAEFIQWKDLFVNTKNYVKNDTITFDIKIDVENPKHIYKSTMNFVSDERRSNETQSSFRMTVENIKNLMAIASPSFKLQGINFDLIVYKSNDNQLGFTLESNNKKNGIPREIKVCIKLLSSVAKKTIEMFHTKQMGTIDVLQMNSMISWNDLLKFKNGYVENGSISVKVKLSAGQHEDAVKRC